MVKIGNVQLQMGGILTCRPASQGPDNARGLFSSKVGLTLGSWQPDSPAAPWQAAPQSVGTAWSRCGGRKGFPGAHTPISCSGLDKVN